MSIDKRIKELNKKLAEFKKAPLSKDRKYHRSFKFEHKVKPDWNAVPKHQAANTSKRTSMLIAWCDKHCQDNYSYDGVTAGFSFESKADAMHFKLVWG